jgi:glycosyltransferase involved in cell wall biosynthesis
VCLPAFRAEPFLAAAIESVLAQTLGDWELVIVDNASPDRTGEIARSYDDPRIVVHNNATTISLQDNWNLAVNLASGRYVKVLPADDLIRPECLEKQVKEMESNPGLALVSCRRDFIDSSGCVVLRSRGLVGLLGERSPDEVVERIMSSGINPIGEPAAMLFRRQHFVAAGHFDASLPFPMDLELTVRLLQHGSFFGQPDPLAAFRVRGDSVTASGIGAQAAEHRILLRRVAADQRWPVGRAKLWRGLALTYVAAVKRRLLFRAVSHGWRPLRRLPALVLSWPSQRHWPILGRPDHRGSQHRGCVHGHRTVPGGGRPHHDVRSQHRGSRPRLPRR